MILPSIEAGATNHQPATAPQAPPPTLPVEPPPDSVVTGSASERLWNAAYDRLEADNAELVGLYIETLQKVLGGEAHEFSVADLSAKPKDPTTRQNYMKKLVQNGQEKISRASRITTGVGDVADFILSIKAMIDLVLQSVPQAAPAADYARNHRIFVDKSPSQHYILQFIDSSEAITSGLATNVPWSYFGSATKYEGGKSLELEPHEAGVHDSPGARFKPAC